MGRAIQLISVFLLRLTVGYAVPAPFPRGQTAVYKYRSDVKAGTMIPAPYASQFALEGTLYVEHDTNDPALKNAYFAALTNVSISMRNGIDTPSERPEEFTPITDDASVIHEPFLIVYDDTGTLVGVKIPPREETWSKNMKIAMASMFQLDLVGMKINEPTKPRSFVSKENTIHGDCWISYDVNVKDQLHPEENEIVVTKSFSPRNCSGFAIREFDSNDDLGCQATRGEPMNVTSRRLVEIEKRANDILIKKLVAYGDFNYSPLNAESGSHYVLTKTTFVLKQVVPVAKLSLQTLNFLNVPMIFDMTYPTPQLRYAVDAAFDVTQGRQVTNSKWNMYIFSEWLAIAADYLDENHLEIEESDWRRGQILNNILLTLSHLDVETFEKIFDLYSYTATIHYTSSKNILREILPQVGTTASCQFILSLVRNRRIPESTMIGMLAKLPLNVREPSEKLLDLMEDLIRLGRERSIIIRRAGILCFSSLVYRTFKNVANPEDNLMLQRYIRKFLGHVKNETSYEMRVVYLMALKNVQVGKIYEHLAPVIRGELTLSEFPVHLRLLAIWAIDKAIEADFRYARDLLWPVMADTSLPVKLRIAAYEILMHQSPTGDDAHGMFWFMYNEGNEHLYNYHLTTILGIARSINPCKQDLVYRARRIMPSTRYTTHHNLSSAYTMDFKDKKNNHAEIIHSAIIDNEATGIQEVLQFEHIVIDDGKIFSKLKVYLHIEGCDELISLLSRGQTFRSGSLFDANVLDLLKRAAKDMPAAKKFHIEAIAVRRGRVILASYYNEKSWNSLVTDLEKLFKLLTEPGYGDDHGHVAINRQIVTYDELREKQLISDMGLPVVFETRVPHLYSLRFTKETFLSETRWVLDFKLWRRGDKSTSIYNPIADLWHVVTRSTATDVNIPIRVNIVSDPEKGNMTFTFPSFPVAGIRTHAKDYVHVNAEDFRALNRTCGECADRVGVLLGGSKKENLYDRLDSRDTGLQYSSTIFDCESTGTPESLGEEWYRLFLLISRNDWKNFTNRVVTVMNRELRNVLFPPQMVSCGKLLEIRPSVDYPVSRIHLRIWTNFGDVDHINNASSHSNSSRKYNICGKFAAIRDSGEFNAQRSWDFNVTVDQGNLKNTAKIRLTRKTPGETNLKICVDVQKRYSPVPMDPLMIDVTEEETNSKLIITAARTDEEKCVLDDILITMTVKGQLSEDQRREYAREAENGSCSMDKSNPLYTNPENIVPKTLNCLNEAIRYTTLRNYSIYLTHRKVPQAITSKIKSCEAILRPYLKRNMDYTITHGERGNTNINVEYPVPTTTEKLFVVHPGLPPKSNATDLNDWHLPLDNTRFNIPFLIKYTYDMLKMCSIYPRTVVTGDGKNISFNNSDQWTLVSGDHIHKTFAVFARMVGDNMDMKIYAGDHHVEIIPSVETGFEVMVDGQAVRQLDNGFLVPDHIGSWIVSITKNGKYIIVRIKNTPLMILHGINHVVLAIDTLLQGRVSGLCGHLDGTYTTRIPKVYTLRKP